MRILQRIDMNAAGLVILHSLHSVWNFDIKRDTREFNNAETAFLVHINLILQGQQHGVSDRSAERP